MKEKAYSHQLWDKALRYGTVFYNFWLKSLYVEWLLPAMCAQAQIYLATHAWVDYQAVGRYAQATEETHRSARIHILPATIATGDEVCRLDYNRFARKTRVLPVESSQRPPRTPHSTRAVLWK